MGVLDRDTDVLLSGARLPQERRLVTTLPGPASAAILARKSAAVAAGVTHAIPVVAVAADGGVLLDADGNSLIDLGSGIAVTTLGAAHPSVTAAIAEQAASFTHSCFMISPYESYIAVAEALNRLTPGQHEKRSALFNSGAEAVENAVKIARRHTGKSAVVAFEHGYHGRTNLTMALTSKAMPYKSGFGPFAPEIYRIPGSYPLRDNLDGAEAARRAISHIEKQIGADNLAAILIEPIQGEGGFIVPAEGFLPALAEWCQNRGVIFIADEIQTGFARTGSMFASELFDIVPDIITTAKGIAGGMPLAAVTGRAEIMDAAQAGGLGGTFGGNPVSCAAALVALRIYEDGRACERAREIEAIIREHLGAVQESDPRIADVRGRGAMMAVEFVDPTSGEPDAALASTVARGGIAEGVIVLSCGTYGNVIRFLPPLTISDELLIEALDILAGVLARHPHHPTTPVARS